MYGYKLLADRLGKTRHVSPLRFKLNKLAIQYPINDYDCIESWLIEVANFRGASIVVRANGGSEKFRAPGLKELSNEALIVALCQLQCLDQPQILRLAAQIISQEKFDLPKLFRVAERERVQPILSELAKQALKVAPTHSTWKAIKEKYNAESELRDPLIHWSRLAEPKVKKGRCQPGEWVLVS